MGSSGQSVHLLQGDLVNLVVDVEAGQVLPVALDHVDQLVRSAVLSGMKQAK